MKYNLLQNAFMSFRKYYFSVVFSSEIILFVGLEEEFCQTETFSADCGHNALIMISSARYGRMHIGRCVLTDYGHVGCTVDVLSSTDRMCSGRRSCTITVPHADFDALHPCPGEFKTFLEISYECISGERKHRPD